MRFALPAAVPAIALVVLGSAGAAWAQAAQPEIPATPNQTQFSSEDAILDTSKLFAIGAHEAEQTLRGAFGWATFQEGLVDGVYFRFDPDGYARFAANPRLDEDAFEVICAPQSMTCAARKDPLEVTLTPHREIQLAVAGIRDSDTFFVSDGANELPLPPRVLEPLDVRMEALLATATALIVRRDGNDYQRISLIGFNPVATYLRWVASGQDPMVFPVGWPVPSTGTGKTTGLTEPNSWTQQPAPGQGQPSFDTISRQRDQSYLPPAGGLAAGGAGGGAGGGAAAGAQPTIEQLQAQIQALTSMLGQAQGVAAGGALVPGVPQPATAQGQVLPGQVLPGQALPGQAIPGQPLPGQPVIPGQGVQAMQGQGLAGQLMPGQPLPGQPLPGQALPGQVLPGQMTPGQMTPGLPAPGQLAQGQLMPGGQAAGMIPAAPGQPLPGGQPGMAVDNTPMGDRLQQLIGRLGQIEARDTAIRAAFEAGMVAAASGQVPNETDIPAAAQAMPRPQAADPLLPGQMMPGQPFPGQPLPGQSSPGQPAPLHAQPGQAIPGHAIPGQDILATVPSGGAAPIDSRISRIEQLLGQMLDVPPEMAGEQGMVDLGSGVFIERELVEDIIRELDGDLGDTLGVDLQAGLDQAVVGAPADPAVRPPAPADAPIATSQTMVPGVPAGTGGTAEEYMTLKDYLNTVLSRDPNAGVQQ